MKKKVYVNNVRVESMEDLEEMAGRFDNICVKRTMTIDDLPSAINLTGNMFVSKTTYAELLRVLAQNMHQEIPAIGWLRRITGWGLKDAKLFIESLYTKPRDDWISVKDETPEHYLYVICATKDGVCEGAINCYHEWRNTYSDEEITVTHWMYYPKMPKEN